MKQNTFIDLPSATPSLTARKQSDFDQIDDQQISAIINTAANVTLEGVMALKIYFEISQIRARGEVEVNLIEAKTRQFQKHYDGLVRLLQEQRAEIKTKGDVLVEILKIAVPVLNSIPDADDNARSLFIKTLPELAAKALDSMDRNQNVHTDY